MQNNNIHKWLCFKTSATQKKWLNTAYYLLSEHFNHRKQSWKNTILSDRESVSLKALVQQTCNHCPGFQWLQVWDTYDKIQSYPPISCISPCLSYKEKHGLKRSTKKIHPIRNKTIAIYVKDEIHFLSSWEPYTNLFRGLPPYEVGWESRKRRSFSPAIFLIYRNSTSWDTQVYSGRWH